MDNRLRRQIENEYPYPVSLEFRRLNTLEYLENNENRLKQLLKTSEATIHLLALISLADLIDNIEKIKDKIPSSYKKEFGGWFTRTTFGKWIAIMRETVKIFKENELPMFIEEMAEFFIKGKNGESEGQLAFNALVSLRNRMAHQNFSPTQADIEQLCREAESHVEKIAEKLSFIVNYPLLHVDNVSVKFHRWSEPVFSHSFAEVIGTSTEFSAYKEEYPDFFNTPAMVVVKRDQRKFLNLEPVIIYSNEGDKKIPDIFLYLDWIKGKEIKYKPVWNGGEFYLKGTKGEKEIKNGLHKIFEYLTEPEVYEGFRNS